MYTEINSVIGEKVNDYVLQNGFVHGDRQAFFSAAAKYCLEHLETINDSYKEFNKNRKRC